MKDTESFYRDCCLCRRRCHADRTLGRAGRCGMTDEVRAARAALHMWEEPCLSGTGGSGAVFFSGCPMRCIFCQNRSIALGRAGMAVTEERLSEIFLELQEKGAHNINLVTPTHYVPTIISAVKRARAAGLHLPIVYNTGSYETVETLRLLEGTVDIFLPDFKYWDPEFAALMAGTPDYPEAARENIAEMVRQAGEMVFDENGIMRKGVIVRHLVMPGHVKDAVAIARYLHETYGNKIFISLMNQYTPMEGAAALLPPGAPPRLAALLSRKVTAREYDKVVDAAIEMGVERAYCQEGGTAEESFIPAFDGEGILKDQ